MKDLQFSHVAISVADLAAQRSFYCRALGMSEVTVDLELKDRQTKLTILRGRTGLQLELVEHAVHEPAPVEGSGKLPSLGYFSWSLAVDDLDAAFGEVVSAGATIVSSPAAATRPGTRFAYLADPEGNLFELLELSPIDPLSVSTAARVGPPAL